MPRPKGYKCSPETIAKQKATRAANKQAQAAQPVKPSQEPS